MMLDKETLVSNDQTLAVAASTVLSDYSIDLGAAPTVYPNSDTLSMDPGRTPKVLLATITQAVTSAGASTTDFQLISADDAALTSNVTVLQTTGAIGKASLVAGYQVRLALPPGITQRYLGLQYVVAVATQTAGKITAGIVADRQTTYVG